MKNRGFFGVSKVTCVRYLTLAFFVFFFQSVRSEELKFSADTYTTNFDTGLTSAQGNVVVFIGKQTLKAQKVKMNSKTGVIEATQNVFFSENKLTIEAESAELNMKNSMGQFDMAILRIGTDIYLEAREISRESETTYRARGAKVTSCQDCPHSWSVAGIEVLLEVESFMKIHHAVPQIFDIPVFYSPFLMLPTKTVRQSGLLFPKMQISPDLGFGLGVPYYWAPSGAYDATVDYRYSRFGGHGVGIEQRWAKSNRSYLRAQTGAVRNISVPFVPNLRGGFSAQNRFQLSSQWVQRFEGQFSTDTRYSNHYNQDFKLLGQPTLAFEPSLEWRNLNNQVRIRAQMNRDNLPRDIPREASIHKLPHASYRAPSQSIFKNFRYATEVDLIQFRRAILAYDEDSSWIRTGDRYTLGEKLFLPLNFGPYLRYQASSELRMDAYHFANSPLGVSPDAHRFRFQVDQEIKTEFSRVYKIDGEGLKALKHSFEPVVRWSYSPVDKKSDHFFFRPSPSPRFDLFDPLSPDISFGGPALLPEEKRLRDHHFMTLGLASRVVGRLGEKNRTYEQYFQANVEKDMSLREDTVDRPLRILAEGGYGGWTLKNASTVQLSGPNKGRAQITNEAGVRRTHFGLKVGQTQIPEQKVYFGTITFYKILGFDWAFNAAWDEKNKIYYGRYFSLVYSGISKCYEFSLVLQEEWDREKQKPGYGIYPTFQLLFDETGVGLGR